MATDNQNTQDALENDIPEMQKTRSSNSTAYMIGAIVIVTIGIVSLLFIMLGSGKANDDKAEESAKTEVVKNDLPALVVEQRRPEPQAAPVKQEPVKVAEPEPIKKPTYVKPVPAVKPQPEAKKEKVITWYDRKRDAGSLQAEATNIKDAYKPEQSAADETDGFLLNRGEKAPQTDLSRQLVETGTPMAIAKMLPDRNYVIAQGTSLDCALETALDSSLSGLTTCILSRDVYSDNGRVLLLDRGTKLTGEYTGGMKNGQKRLFVLWTRAKTPNGVIVSLNSPSADPLGRSGASGWVDTHFAERFGTAIFLSILSDAAQVYSANQNSGDGVIIGNSAETGSDVAEDILKYQADIPPTLIKNQGETIKVMVARDLNFADVYGLKMSQQ
jgi:type IV secretion system protein VirB10